MIQIAKFVARDIDGSANNSPNRATPVTSKCATLCRQPIEHGAGGLQIRGREAVGEPIISRCEQCSRLLVATLGCPQTGNAEGDPQFPEQRSLLPSDLKRSIELRVG
jgi:hypothetical protein